MKNALLAAALLLALPARAQTPDQKPPATLRSILLEQLHTTHDKEDWFVCANIAVQGLTPEQASWTDGKGNHSIGQLANHLIFWDQRSLQRFKGLPQEKFSGNNDETFNAFDEKNWAATVKKLDEVMTAWEKAVESADDATLNKYASMVAHIGAHNAYHIGQIIYIRKLQGSWDPSKGVK
jgi:uncharacterized damage-inducible protein DinB